MSEPDGTELPGKIGDLICFALYSANHAMNRAYKPHLTEIGLTYPQYITLTALWETDKVTVGSLCDRLLIETSTLTPLLKRLEKLGHVERKRSDGDERQVFVTLTEAGRALKQKAPDITTCIIDDTGVPAAKLDELVHSIGEMRDNLLSKRVRK